MKILYIARRLDGGKFDVTKFDDRRFFKTGNTNVVIGKDEEKTDQVLNFIKVMCHNREQFIAT